MPRLTLAVVAVATYVVVALLLQGQGVFAVVVGAAGTTEGRWIVDYALPPLLPGALFAALLLSTRSGSVISWRKALSAAVLVPLVVLLVAQRGAWIHPLATWASIRGRWAHPYVSEAIFMAQRELTYAFVCTLAAGLATMAASRYRRMASNPASSPTTRST
jgi:hypothetical protein